MGLVCSPDMGDAFANAEYNRRAFSTLSEAGYTRSEVLTRDMEATERGRQFALSRAPGAA